MAKYIKMAIYGEPGVGKSTFAAKAPKPFFITTDGNYEYLEDFCGAKPEDHVQCFSWAEMKKAFSRDFSNYETIVVDLLEDSYLWAENEFCKDNRIQHISDLGYGKGYGILGNDFFIEYQKLLAQPKNIILIMHGVSEVLKDRRGVEYTKYGPSKLVREKLITQIEGRVRFFLRAYAEAAEDAEGRLVTKRYLSMSPDGNTEYGITRGLSSDIPRAIPLDWDTFVSVVDNASPTSLQKAPEAPVSHEAPAVVEEPKKRGRKPSVKPTEAVETTETMETTEATETTVSAESTTEKPVEAAIPDVDEIRAKLQAVLAKSEKVTPEESPVEASPVEAPVEETPKPVSQADRLAAIRAKMAALKK